MSKLCLSTGLCLLLGLVAIVPAGRAQEVKHAPTVEQRRADQRLWISRLEESNGAGLTNVSFDELFDWQTVMDDCEKVDPELRSRYYNTEAETAWERLTRVENFLARHNLYGQFKAEDAQGKR